MKLYRKEPCALDVEGAPSVETLKELRTTPLKADKVVGNLPDNVAGSGYEARWCDDFWVEHYEEWVSNDRMAMHRPAGDPERPAVFSTRVSAANRTNTKLPSRFRAEYENLYYDGPLAVRIRRDGTKELVWRGYPDPQGRPECLECGGPIDPPAKIAARFYLVCSRACAVARAYRRAPKRRRRDNKGRFVELERPEHLPRPDDSQGVRNVD